MGLPEVDVSEIMSFYPGRTNILSHLSILMAVAPPPFMHIFDPHTPRMTCQLIASVLDVLNASENPEIKPLRYACVDAREVVATRQFYDRAINAFAGHRPTRANGYENWGGGTWSDCFDSFVAGLREIGKTFSGGSEKKKSEAGDAMDITETSDPMLQTDNPCNLILVVENANYLTGTLKELLVPLTRLSEMVNTFKTMSNELLKVNNTQTPNAALVLISDVQWDDIRETARACPDPYLIKVPALSREDTLLYLVSHFPAPFKIGSSVEPPAGLPPLTAAHDDLIQLRPFFLAQVYNICSSHSRDPSEIAYVASATWPAFVAPILADWEIIRASQIPTNDMDVDVDVDDSKTVDTQSPEKALHDWQHADAAEYPLPIEATRIRLMRYFSPSILAAFHELHPRKISARAWAKAHVPPATFRASVWESYPQTQAVAENSQKEAPKASLKTSELLHDQ